MPLRGAVKRPSEAITPAKIECRAVRAQSEPGLGFRAAAEIPSGLPTRNVERVDVMIVGADEDGRAIDGQDLVRLYLSSRPVRPNDGPSAVFNA